MKEEINSFQFFCEGPHDVAFLKKILRIGMGFSKLEVVFSNLPSPFHNMYIQTIKKHAAKDLSLDMAHKFFLPDVILKKDNNIVIIYNSGGKTNYDKVKILLESYLTLQPQAKTFAGVEQDYIVSDKYVFFYDADDLGINTIVSEVSNNFTNVGKFNFIESTFIKSDISDCAYISDNKAVYTWGENSNEGTLEDIIYPMYESDQSILIDQAKDAIDSMFNWETTIPQLAKRKKSIITTMGQKQKPGLPMSVILSETKLIKKETWRTHEKTRDIINFLTSFIG